jgi:hypothetical protein
MIKCGDCKFLESEDSEWLETRGASYCRIQLPPQFWHKGSPRIHQPENSGCDLGIAKETSIKTPL